MLVPPSKGIAGQAEHIETRTTNKPRGPGAPPETPEASRRWTRGIRRCSHHLPPSWWVALSAWGEVGEEAGEFVVTLFHSKDSARRVSGGGRMNAAKMRAPWEWATDWIVYWDVAAGGHGARRGGRVRRVSRDGC